jgi:hypothetical protein
VVSGPVHECAAGCGQPLTQWQRTEDGRAWHPKCVPPGLPLRGTAPRRPAAVEADTIVPPEGLL